MLQCMCNIMESDDSNDTSSESGNDDPKPQKFSRSARSSSHESILSTKSSSRSSSSSTSSEKSIENVNNECQSPVGKADSPKSLINGNCESPKSVSSKNSTKSKASDDSNDDESVKSDDSRNRRKVANLDDGNTSDSSERSIDSTRAKTKPTNLPEAVSEEEADSPKSPVPVKPDPPSNIIPHEDLSDVSDLEDSLDASDNEEITNLKEKNGIKETYSNRDKKPVENDVEEQLDFEAEDGECADTEPTQEPDSKNDHEAGELDDETDSKKKSKEDLEDGEITDEDDVRPEETEPRPVCRFFSRGQCTWGASCRFLHPGVTDKGNYTMFDIVRPVVTGDYVTERPPSFGLRADPPPLESAWERGLRTAKEMMRKSIKRKEQDIDFEEKKLNLSIAQEELDKENGYYAKAPTPEPRYLRIGHAPLDDYPPMRIPPQEYYGRRPIIYDPPEYMPPPRERIRYREVPVHRTGEYYSSKHEEETPVSSSNKTRKPKREVIVQRLEDRSTRGDEWSDPWMRSKSPASRKGPRKRSYSSASSYSSSSSSASSRSSYRSRSHSRHKRSPHRPRRQVSPSVIVSERKAANERAALMNPPAPRKKAPSPGMMRVVGAQNPPAPVKVDQFGRTRSKLAVAAALARVKGRPRSSRSSSASSSGSSSSDSESSGSSSSSSRRASPLPRRPSGTGVDLALAYKAKAIDALKSGSEKKQIKLNLKNSAPKKADLADMVRKADSSRKRLATSPPAPEPTKAISNKKASSRREELLKQLKAVEDAIAKKRSKV